MDAGAGREVDAGGGGGKGGSRSSGNGDVDCLSLPAVVFPAGLAEIFKVEEGSEAEGAEALVVEASLSFFFFFLLLSVVSSPPPAVSSDTSLSFFFRFFFPFSSCPVSTLLTT